MIDIKEIKDEAQKELNEERVKEAKSRVKAKLKEIAQTETILSNQKRELQDLYDAISQGN